MTTPINFASGPQLPLPRLQITWQQDGPCRWLASYDLLIPVSAYDVRNNGPDGGVGEGPGFVAAHIGLTTATRSRGPVCSDGSIDTPFRDGVHIAWDSHRLNLPAYVVCGDRWERIRPEPAPAAWDRPALDTDMED